MSTRDKVLAIVAKRSDTRLDALRGDMSLSLDLGLDVLDMLALEIEIEDDLGVDLGNPDPGMGATVNWLCDLVEQKVAGQ